MHFLIYFLTLDSRRRLPLVGWPSRSIDVTFTDLFFFLFLFHIFLLLFLTFGHFNRLVTLCLLPENCRRRLVELSRQFGQLRRAGSGRNVGPGLRGAETSKQRWKQMSDWHFFAPKRKPNLYPNLSIMSLFSLISKQHGIVSWCAFFIKKFCPNWLAPIFPWNSSVVSVFNSAAHSWGVALLARNLPLKDNTRLAFVFSLFLLLQQSANKGQKWGFHSLKTADSCWSMDCTFQPPSKTEKFRHWCPLVWSSN